MTDATPSPTRRAAGRLALRACVRGLLASALVPAVVLASGLAPQGAAGLVVLGWAAAALSGVAGLLVQARLATVPAEHPTALPGYVAALLLNFLLQAVVVALGVGVLVWLETKFELTAAFALIFAAAATILHTVGVVTVAGAIRAAEAGGAPRAVPIPDGPTR